MAKLLLSAFFIGACLVPGLSSYPKDPSQDAGSYVIFGEPTRLHETDPLTGQLITHRVIPLSPDEVVNSRVKRQVQIKQEETDKSALLKTNPGTKKPTLNSKETSSKANATITKSSQTDSNNTSSPTSNSSGSKSVVLDVVPTTIPLNASKPGKVIEPISPTVGSGDNGTSSATTSAPIDIDETHPTFPYDDNEGKEFDEDLKRENGTKKKKDTHKYYNSTYVSDGVSLWINLDEHATTVDHELLSDAHRRAATVTIPFDFPFYGHYVRNVTVATGGFLYLGEQVHAWLAATQYVAPLMANFDSRFNNATVRYLAKDKFFTVEWHEVRLQDASDRGAFTFQTTLHKNGSIVFAFKDIPFPVKEINDTHHPVKVGLSDAYISDRTILFVKQKTIYEYHRIDLSQYNITNGSAIIFTSLPTCLSFDNCPDCTSRAQEIGFECEWCPSLKRCSDGTDRHRQEWMSKNCKAMAFKARLECFSAAATPSTDIYHNILGQDDHDLRRFNHPDAQEKKQSHLQADSNTPDKVFRAEEPHGMAAAGVIGILFLITLVLGGGGWAVYAYHYPHSPSGQLLIRFRPSQWRSFRRGEARYTAASIHM